jgi:ComF family protein
MRQKIASITQWFSIPTVCVLCHHHHAQSSSLCSTCSQLLTRLHNPCQYCACPLPSEQFLICGECLRKKPAFDRVITAYTFEEPLRSLLHEFKYLKALHLRPLLAALMIEAYDEKMAQADCIMPTPLHTARICERGFNQAAELAKIIAKKIKKPYVDSICKKINNTLPQVGLTAQDRRKNLRYTFIAKPSPYQHVLMIDDLVTTGSTANEIARTLKRQGVKHVDIWCCARAI